MRHNIQPGEWVIQTAATSHFGRILIQLAQLRRFRVLNVVRHQSQIAELTQLGADAVITNGELTPDTVSRVTDGKMPRYAIDSMGGELGTQLVSLLQSRGVYVALVFRANL